MTIGIHLARHLLGFLTSILSFVIFIPLLSIIFYLSRTDVKFFFSSRLVYLQSHHHLYCHASFSSILLTTYHDKLHLRHENKISFVGMQKSRNELSLKTGKVERNHRLELHDLMKCATRFSPDTNKLSLYEKKQMN